MSGAPAMGRPVSLGGMGPTYWHPVAWVHAPGPLSGLAGVLASSNSADAVTNVFILVERISTGVAALRRGASTGWLRCGVFSKAFE